MIQRFLKTQARSRVTASGFPHGVPLVSTNAILESGSHSQLPPGGVTNVIFCCSNNLLIQILTNLSCQSCPIVMGRNEVSLLKVCIWWLGWVIGAVPIPGWALDCPLQQDPGSGCVNGRPIKSWMSTRGEQGRGSGARSGGCGATQSAQSRKKSYADHSLRSLRFRVGDRDFFHVSPKKGVMRFRKRGKIIPSQKFNPKWRLNPHHNHSQLPQHRDEEVNAKKHDQKKKRARRDRLYNLNRSGTNIGQRRESVVFKSPIDIQPEWNMLDQIPFLTFSKLALSIPKPEDLLIYGGLEFYDRYYDWTTPKIECRLDRFMKRNFFKITTSDDPVIHSLANEDKATVFAMDTILSTLMCAPRSVYSWDNVVQCVGNKLCFDKRDGSHLDFLSIQETLQEPLPDVKDDINSAYSLSVEAPYINQNFS
ncbi:Eukaryotic translation initiation factor 3 subunit D [Capsicum annuum]|uniref:Eukaryotic translation initiation factor 3 subunit D n=1 Tax=Capsicum annuum TaxID=4072 RepID=A0A2G2YW98_CAPAN|nr:Eukaryotic translation initiation factor 3 subunit D [Capsicum annuum]KAF3644994.1 Eukaryotic translation initiation factor 3 subunit D [Capsicum annuum]PHT74004.1 Eukaryotic translation initiation factor 3 subunit D [Capsicum annuum]